MKTIRTWVYGFVKFLDKIVVIKKSRWPFTWLYDLPGWKIEHWESHINSLKRELREELWLKESDYNIERLFTVEEDFIKHVWNWVEKDEHIIAIIYEINILNNDFDLDYIEQNGDSSWIKLIYLNDKKLWKTNILKKLIKKLCKQ